MAYWRLVPLIVITALVQVGLLPYLQLGYAIPNLVMLVVATLIILEQDLTSLWWMALGGLVLDLFSPFPFGIYTLQLMLLFFLLRYLIRPLISEPAFYLAFAIFIFVSLLWNGLHIFYLHQPPLPAILIAIAYDVALGMVIYYFTLRCHRRSLPIKI